MSKVIDELLSKSNIAINNYINQEPIANQLLEYGYTPERMAVGQEFLNKAQLLNATQAKEDGEQLAASENLSNSMKEANAVYIPHLKVARIVFRNNTSLSAQLQLSGKRKKSQSGWLSQTKIFYSNLLSNEDALSQMANFGQTREKLENGQQLVLKAEEQLALRKKEMGEAQDATQARDEAVDELQDWYSDYIEIARLALADQPQYLEMLGIISPS